MQARAYSCILLTGLAACGTVVGNPKKPGSGTGTPQPAAAFVLPLVDFAVPTEDDAALALRADDAFDQRADKSTLSDTRRRLDRSLAHIDAFSARLNKIVEKETAGDDGVLRFAGRGDDDALSGLIEPLAAGDFAYQAVVCHQGALLMQFKWSGDGGRIELVKDFAAQTATGEDHFELKGRISVTKAAAVTVVMDTQGRADTEIADQEGFGLTERAVAARDAAGVVTIKTTGDRYQTEPEAGAFEGDYYLTGRLVPRAGTAKFDTEFVSYFKGRRVLCRQGFDEDAADLWAPDLSGPRFCLGRPLGKGTFGSSAEFLETVAGLEVVGIVKAAELGAVSFEAGLGCD